MAVATVRADGSAPLAFGRVVIIGGGCYGSYYLQQLRRARARGAAVIRELLLVDRDPACRVAREAAEVATGAQDHRLVVAEWEPFLEEFLRGPTAADDAIVPSPLMPHLLLYWLRDRAEEEAPGRRVQLEVPPPIDGVPWQRAGSDGSRYVSFAEWMCPVNCIEPRVCPHTRAERDWSMATTIAAMDGVSTRAVLHCTHRTFGVGMIDVADIQRAAATVRAMAARGEPSTVAVGTVSHCHGAVGTLRLD